jgi:hypothetical protein
MTTPENKSGVGGTSENPVSSENPEVPAAVVASGLTPEYQGVDDDGDRRKRRLLLLLLLVLLLCLCCVGTLAVRYLLKPQPIAELIPANQNINYPPTYKYSIDKVDRPIGVAVSPDNQRIYVAESGGERLVKMFDRNGTLIKDFAPAGTTKSTREPRYLAVDAKGRVFLVDQLANAIQIFDADGNYLDAILGQDMTITKFLGTNIPKGMPAGTTFHYDGVNQLVYYTLPGGTEQNLKYTPTKGLDWSPLGIRFNKNGDLMYSDITTSKNSIHIIPVDALNGSLKDFNPNIASFAHLGRAAGSLIFHKWLLMTARANSMYQMAIITGSLSGLRICNTKQNLVLDREMAA